MAKVEHSLFENGFLVNSIGQIAQKPEVAIAELVANAWDAGASRVDIEIPAKLGEQIVVSDDGVGLSPQLFRDRWMKLGYRRVATGRTACVQVHVRREYGSFRQTSARTVIPPSCCGCIDRRAESDPEIFNQQPGRLWDSATGFRRKRKLNAWITLRRYGATRSERICPSSCVMMLHTVALCRLSMLDLPGSK